MTGHSYSNKRGKKQSNKRLLRSMNLAVGSQNWVKCQLSNVKIVLTLFRNGHLLRIETKETRSELIRPEGAKNIRTKLIIGTY